MTCGNQPLMHPLRHPRICPTRRVRNGSITVELLLNLPIWLIMLAALVGFGRLLSEAQQVALASRVGAEAASQVLCLPETGELPHDVVEVVQRALGVTGLQARKVILQHNAAGRPVTLEAGPGRALAPPTSLPKDGVYVRVTVLARDAGFASWLLAWIGVDPAGLGMQQSTTFRYEMQPKEER